MARSTGHRVQGTVLLKVEVKVEVEELSLIFNRQFFTRIILNAKFGLHYHFTDIPNRSSSDKSGHCGNL